MQMDNAQGKSYTIPDVKDILSSTISNSSNSNSSGVFQVKVKR